MVASWMRIRVNVIYVLCILIILILQIIYHGIYKSFPTVSVKMVISRNKKFISQRNAVHDSPLGLSHLENAVGFHNWCVKHQRFNLSYTFYADKHDVKDYVKRIVPNLKIATEYAFVSRADDINETLLLKLPVSYMFKANHLAGGIAFVQDNVIKCVRRPCPVRHTTMTDLEYLKKLCRTWLEKDYAKYSHEVYYKNIKHKCMFEEMLGNITVIKDYKVFTFHGKPYFIQTDIDRYTHHKRDFYTPNWTRMSITKAPPKLAYDKPEVEPQPIFLGEMLEVSETLAKQFVMMRVDFLSYGDNFAFGELSPSPQNCNGQFVPAVVEKFYGYISETARIQIDPDIIVSLLDITGDFTS